MPKSSKRKRTPRAVTVADLVTYTSVAVARDDLKRRLRSYAAQTARSGKGVPLSATDDALFKAVIRSFCPSAAEWLATRSVHSLRVTPAAVRNGLPRLIIKRSGDARELAFSVAATFETFDARENKRRAAVLAAMRNEVRDQLQRYARDLHSTSALCAEHAHRFDARAVRAHTRYRKPHTFESIVRAFEEQALNGLEIDVLPVVNLLASAASQRAGAANKYANVHKGVWEMQPGHFKTLWVDFHDTHATYELICDDCANRPHKSKAKK